MADVPLGIYLSIPFCPSKCTYCNFASDVVRQPAAARQATYEAYVSRLCAEMAAAESTAARLGGAFSREVDSVYLGGGTPSVLNPAQLERLFAALRREFTLTPESEITVECAPGTLTPEVLETLLRCGVNRLSLGVQSFVDREIRAVGRLHSCAIASDDIARLRAAGMENFNLDLIAGLPHQTPASWRISLQQALALGAPHVSVYMLEVDADSRLGREVMAGGTRYHAGFVPDEELISDLYLEACDRLNAAGVAQYEISNFARPAYASRHNLKYWTRQPYLGFGLDAHSFLPAARGFLPQEEEPGPVSASREPTRDADSDLDAVRFANPDSLESYLAGAPVMRTPVSRLAAREECFFLGLRLNHGVELEAIAQQYGTDYALDGTIEELRRLQLLDYDPQRHAIRLTSKGRLLANEVFERFLA
jgi:oxygen-independent coproporphyrinogen-3 oxidase